MCDLTYDPKCADIPALHRINIYKFAVNRAGVMGFLVQVSGTPFLHVVVLAQVFGYLCLRCEGVMIEVFTCKYCQQSCIWLSDSISGTVPRGQWPPCKLQYSRLQNIASVSIWSKLQCFSHWLYTANVYINIKTLMYVDIPKKLCKGWDRISFSKLHLEA